MRRSSIMDAAARLVFHSAMLLSLYLLFAGHNQPGGGFIGGLVAGAAVAVHYVAGGIDDVRAVIGVRPWTILGAGLALAGTTGLTPLVTGGSVLAAEVLHLQLPLLGAVKVPSVLLFDAGVYAVVVGLVFMVFEGFGEESVPEERAR